MRKKYTPTWSNSWAFSTSTDDLSTTSWAFPNHCMPQLGRSYRSGIQNMWLVCKSSRKQSLHHLFWPSQPMMASSDFASTAVLSQSQHGIQNWMKGKETMKSMTKRCWTLCEYWQSGNTIYKGKAIIWDLDWPQESWILYVCKEAELPTCKLVPWTSRVQFYSQVLPRSTQ